ncbi:unnamed protein product [Musa textilis]
MRTLVLHQPLAAKASIPIPDPPQISSSMEAAGRRRRKVCPTMEENAQKKTATEASRAAEEEKVKKRTAVKASARQCHREGMDSGSTLGDIEDFPADEAQRLRAALLRWYDVHRRVLPWRTASSGGIRGNGDEGKEVDQDRAYAVWVSEVMLQQTRVQTVIAYYNRWMDKWPTVHHLASASQEEVNEVWAGLGYYRRARFLLEGAKSIVQEGEFPRTASELRKVRGIGDYTAGAIASIAFNEAVPVVDGNVVRVISRLKAISANPKKSTTVKGIWKLAAQLVDPLRPGDSNQAMMELGATLCSTTSPGCSACPISEACLALSLSRSSGSTDVTDYPSKVAKTKQRHDFAAVCVVQLTEGSDEESLSGRKNNDVLLLVKRPEEGLLAGLWEFPTVLLDEEVIDVGTRRKIVDKYLKELFLINLKEICNVILREDVGKYVHIFSHIRLHMHVELLILKPEGGLRQFSEKIQCTSAWKCVDGKSMKNMGLTSGVRKVYNMIQDYKKKQLLQRPKLSLRKKCKSSI